MCRSWSWWWSSQATWGAACADQDGQEAVKRDCRLPLDKLSHKLYLVFYYAIAVTQAVLAKYSSTWCFTMYTIFLETNSHTSSTCQVQLFLIFYYAVFLETKSHTSSTCQVQLYLIFYYTVFLESHSLTQAVLASSIFSRTPTGYSRFSTFACCLKLKLY